MFEHLIVVKPLRLMYGSVGAFLSPENLVGRSGAKFPPDAATLSGLFFSAIYKDKARKEEVKGKLRVAGPFWADYKNPKKIGEIYVPMPWTKIIAKKEEDEWQLKKQEDEYIWYRDKQNKKNENKIKKDERQEIEPEYSWLPITDWNQQTKIIHRNTRNGKSAKKAPWKFAPILHPKMEKRDRVTVSKDGLFLENAVQMPEETCLVYLSTHKLDDGWYKFGGENHLVEITSESIKPNSTLYKLLREPIQKAFALITPGVWGSNRLSCRHPQKNKHSDPKIPPFPKVVQMLTDKPIPYRYSSGGRLGRGRYAVPAGSVYVLSEPLKRTWWDWEEEWFLNEGYSLQKLGCGLCLPLDIQGLS